MECILQYKQIVLRRSVDMCFLCAEVMGFRVKREYKAALDAIAASNTIASLSNILPTDFVVHLVADRLEKVRDR